MSDTLKEIKRFVLAGNIPLGLPYVDDKNNQHPPKITEMDPVILLRNLHPTLRAEYARKLVQEGLLTEAESHEFTRSQ